MWPGYLQRLQDANPALRDPDAKMSLTVSSFLRQIERAYAAGAADVRETIRSSEAFARTAASNESLPEALRDLFRF